jgi:hypothetical protein
MGARREPTRQSLKSYLPWFLALLFAAVAVIAIVVLTRSPRPDIAVTAVAPPQPVVVVAAELEPIESWPELSRRTLSGHALPPPAAGDFTDAEFRKLQELNAALELRDLRDRDHIDRVLLRD